MIYKAKIEKYYLVSFSICIIGLFIAIFTLNKIDSYIFSFLVIIILIFFSIIFLLVSINPMFTYRLDNKKITINTIFHLKINIIEFEKGYIIDASQISEENYHEIDKLMKKYISSDIIYKNTCKISDDLILILKEKNKLHSIIITPSDKKQFINEIQNYNVQLYEEGYSEENILQLFDEIN